VPSAPPPVVVRLYGELLDFLPRGAGGGSARVTLTSPASVKDLLESLGVPHPEVDVVLVDGEPVGFDRVVRGGERVAAYPLFRSLSLEGVRRAGPEEPAPDRFLLDVHLGALARMLRLCGIDAELAPCGDDAGIVRRACESGRTILTRDVGLLKRAAVRHGHWVRATDPPRQASEVLRRFGLRRRVAPFTRCLACNGTLRAVGRDDPPPEVPEGVAARFDDFTRCGACGRVYWRGSHYARLAGRLAALLRGA